MDNWESRRTEILHRDNYSCQRCNQFNPSLGVVQLVDEGSNEVELHEYEYDAQPYCGTYRISQSKTGYTFNYEISHCLPVFPIMQVHHKRYINGRSSWEHEDNDLITLCKKCHTTLHEHELIPIYSTHGSLIERKKFTPIDSGSGRKHNIGDWNFVGKGNQGEYAIAEIRPTLKIVLFKNEDFRSAIEEGQKAFANLMRNYFHEYINFYIKNFV